MPDDDEFRDGGSTGYSEYGEENDEPDDEFRDGGEHGYGGEDSGEGGYYGDGYGGEGLGDEKTWLAT